MGQHGGQGQGANGRPQADRLVREHTPLGGEGRILVLRRQPPVGQRHLDHKHHPDRVRLGQCRPGRLFKRVPGRQDAVEQPLPRDLDVQDPEERLGLAGAGQRQADPRAIAVQASRTLSHGGVLQHAGVERRRMDLVEV